MDETSITFDESAYETQTFHPSAKGTTVADCLRVGTEAYLQYCTDPGCWNEKRAKQWAAVLKAIIALGPDAVR